jgi:type VI secretion system protein VasG
MADIKRTTLFGKLNSLAFKSIEGATTFCEMRGNRYVELVHWIHQILQAPDSDISLLVRHYGLDPSRLSAQMTIALDRLPRGATSISDFSPHIEEAIKEGWICATLLTGESQVRTGHLLAAALKKPELKSVLLNISGEFAKIKVDDLTDHFAALLKSSAEEHLQASDGTQLAAAGAAADGGAPGGLLPGKQEALGKYAVDLTEKARNGDLDPIAGRDEEIRQIVDILMRRRQNNPILTGEAGVGKTAVVEGFAIRVASGDVPPALREVSVRTLDLGLLQAGASMKGEFENRLKQVIEEVQSSPQPIILFIDEAHTLIGAGGSAGQGDAANLLKPALARGTLRTIAATTWAEYKKYFEKDAALTRRFQVIKVEEPVEEKAILMVRGLVTPLEKHHRVQVLDEAVEAAVRLSHRYIPSRQLPDKAVSLLDTACARVAISQHATPPEVEDSQHCIQGLEVELEIIDREAAVGHDHEKRRADLVARLEAERARLVELEANWKREKELVDHILELRGKLRALQIQAAQAAAQAAEATQASEAAAATGTAAANAPAATAAAGATAAVPDLAGKDRVAILKELADYEVQLAALQGEAPLILPAVDEQAVASVVADWTGIPVGRMVKNEIEAVLSLADNLEKRIIGQRHALDAIAKRIQTSRARLDNPSKPIGVFMLAGTSGVGKTETALALAECLYGGESNVITINMSEFQEAHTVSTLKGAPPGYVGYGEGGVLTEAVRRRPYSVVLLDEVEKAHTDVHEIFFQVFDKGWMEDGEGRRIDFKNTIILLTTNAGSDLIMNMCKDPDLIPDTDGLAKALRPSLLKIFPAALLGRLVVVPYYPLSDPMLKSIIRLQLGRIQKRIAENHGIALTYDDAVVELIASRCTEVESGGRMVDAILTQTMLPEMSREILSRVADGILVSRILVSQQTDAFAYQFE